MDSIFIVVSALKSRCRMFVEYRNALLTCSKKSKSRQQTGERCCGESPAPVRSPCPQRRSSPAAQQSRGCTSRTNPEIKGGEKGLALWPRGAGIWSVISQPTSKTRPHGAPNTHTPAHTAQTERTAWSISVHIHEESRCGRDAAGFKPLALPVYLIALSFRSASQSVPKLWPGDLICGQH